MFDRKFKKKAISSAVTTALLASVIASGTAVAEEYNTSNNGVKIISGDSQHIISASQNTNRHTQDMLKGGFSIMGWGDEAWFRLKKDQSGRTQVELNKELLNEGTVTANNLGFKGFVSSTSQDGKVIGGMTTDGDVGIWLFDSDGNKGAGRITEIKRENSTTLTGIITHVSQDGKYASFWSKDVNLDSSAAYVYDIDALVKSTSESDRIKAKAILANSSVSTLSAKPYTAANAVETADDGTFIAVGNEFRYDDALKPVDSGALVWTTKDKDKEAPNSNIYVGQELYKSSEDAYSTATAISKNTKIIGGAENSKPVIWSGFHWGSLTQLKLASAETQGAVAALSANGSVAVGNTFDTATDQKRAVKWSGDNWTELSDLGTLKKDNSGNSTVNTITSDGTIASGSADADDGTVHGIIWKIAEKEKQEKEKQEKEKQEKEKQEKEKQEQEKQEQEKQEQEKQEQEKQEQEQEQEKRNKSDTDKVIKKVDVTNTNKTIAQMASDTFQIIENQHRALTRLQDICGAGEGETCWSVQRGYTSAGKVRDNSAGVSVGYGFSDNISAGLSLDTSDATGRPSSYKKATNSFGVGFSVDLHSAFDGGDWYIRPAVAFNKSNTQVERQTLSNTEAGKGSSSMKGLGASLEGGQNFHLNEAGSIGWYAGARYSDVSRAGFTETNADFPVTYGELKDKRTSVYAGARATVPVTQNVNWVSGLEVAQLLSKDPTFTASADHIGQFSHKAGLKKTTASAKTGVEYAVTRNVSVSLTPTVNLTATGDTAWGGLFGVSGHF
ncbi:flagellar motor protein MotB [Kluyvera sp. 1366]